MRSSVVVPNSVYPCDSAKVLPQGGAGGGCSLRDPWAHAPWHPSTSSTTPHELSHWGMDSSRPPDSLNLHGDRVFEQRLHQGELLRRQVARETCIRTFSNQRNPRPPRGSDLEPHTEHPVYATGAGAHVSRDRATPGLQVQNAWQDSGMAGGPARPVHDRHTRDAYGRNERTSPGGVCPSGVGVHAGVRTGEGAPTRCRQTTPHARQPLGTPGAFF